jgi:hypothetical protein
VIERESTGDGWQVRLVATAGQQLARGFAAAFLCLWLCGWAAGEYFALSALTGILAERFAPGMQLAWLPHVRGPASAGGIPVVAFLGLWLTGWTVGGCFAIGALVQLLFGVQVLRWSSAGVEVATAVGPFVTRRRLTWDQAEAMVNGTAGAQRVAGKSLRLLAGPIGDDSDRAMLVTWLREARAAAPGAEPPENLRAIG